MNLIQDSKDSSVPTTITRLRDHVLPPCMASSSQVCSIRWLCLAARPCRPVPGRHKTNVLPIRSFFRPRVLSAPAHCPTEHRCSREDVSSSRIRGGLTSKDSCLCCRRNRLDASYRLLDIQSFQVHLSSSSTRGSSTAVMDASQSP